MHLDQLIETSLGRPQRNIYGDLGPRCLPCSGLGVVLRPGGENFNTHITQRASLCGCEGSGLDLVAIERMDREHMWAQIHAIESKLGLPITSRFQMPTLKMSRQTWMEAISWLTADGTAIANSTTETIVIPNITIPANYLADGRALRLTYAGRLSTTGTPTVRFRVRWGGVAGTVIWDSGTITCGSGVTAALWAIRDLLVQTRSNGATGTVFTIGDVIVGAALAPTVGSATGAAAVGVFGSAGDDTPAAVTIDATADTALSITALWSAASASNTLTGHQALMESLN